MSTTTAPRRALLVIDVQNEYFTGDMPIEYPSVDLSLPNIVTAMAAARAAGVPVIVVQHDAPEASPIFAKGSDGWQLHPQVASFAADHRINKSMGSAFAGTDLRAWLERHGIDTLTVTGYMTHNCDAATIYQAAHDGLQVEFLHDATGTLPYANAGGTASAEEICSASQPNSRLKGCISAPGKPSAADEVKAVRKVMATMTQAKCMPRRASHCEKG